MSDDSSVEGGVFQSLFRTELSSSSCSSDSASQQEECRHKDQAGPENIHHLPLLVTRECMHVTIQQQQVGGSIAQRLWPAAQALAAFMLENQDILAAFQQHTAEVVHIIELGAGVGLTGLELATQLPVKVLLTDLDEARPLLRANTQLNSQQFHLRHDAVTIQTLEWGNELHVVEAMEWFHSSVSKIDSAEMPPLLVIGSDCVYWETLHEPLETAIYQILSRAPSGSMCLLAGMRRWKSDTKFYKTFGKRTASLTHRLVAECIDEQVERTAKGRREITRIYKIVWQESDNRKQSSIATI